MQISCKTAILSTLADRYLLFYPTYQAVVNCSAGGIQKLLQSLAGAKWCSISTADSSALDQKQSKATFESHHYMSF